MLEGSGKKLKFASDDGSKTYEVMLNPKEIKTGGSIKYNTKSAQGETETEAKFQAYCPSNLDLEIVIDGTGIVDDKRTDVDAEIAALREVVYNFVGPKHEPSAVRVTWGVLNFRGRLTSLDTTYTVLTSEGKPVRAVVKMAFISSVASDESAVRAGKSSPDLAHLVEVTEGDTLPLLCQRIYQDPSYYAEVAKVNGLTDFRRLKAGAQLAFPPLR